MESKWSRDVQYTYFQPSHKYVLELCTSGSSKRAHPVPHPLTAADLWFVYAPKGKFSKNDSFALLAIYFLNNILIRKWPNQSLINNFYYKLGRLLEAFSKDYGINKHLLLRPELFHVFANALSLLVSILTSKIWACPNAYLIILCLLSERWCESNLSISIMRLKCSSNKTV